MVITFSLIFLGCLQPPVPTPTPTATPIVTVTEKPTAVPATPRITPSPTPERIPLVYKVYVSQDYGFYKTIPSNYTQFVYINHTLNINSGDTVIWYNDAENNEILTIVSEQSLWRNASAKLNTYQHINYTFTKPGTYSVYIQELPKLKHQKIVVSK